MESIKSILRPIWNHYFIWDLRGVFFDLSEVITNYRLEKKKFKKMLGYDLDLKNPKSFSHHIVCKKIYDRNPLLPILCDKYRAREYIRKILGAEKAEKFLVPLLWVGEDPEMIPFDEFRSGYVIKVNHNSGPNFIVKKGEVPDRNKIINEIKKQLKYSYGILKHEWAYKKIEKRLVIVEKFLQDADGRVPKDYKIHMISGECAFIQVDLDRFDDHSRSIYDKEWRLIKGTMTFKQGREEDKPKNFDIMIDLAKKLSNNLDYIRIDQYNIDGQIYMGEMTNYPRSGVEEFNPVSLDFYFGSLWKK